MPVRIIITPPKRQPEERLTTVDEIASSLPASPIESPSQPINSMPSPVNEPSTVKSTRSSTKRKRDEVADIEIPDSEEDRQTDSDPEDCRDVKRGRSSDESSMPFYCTKSSQGLDNSNSPSPKPKGRGKGRRKGKLNAAAKPRPPPLTEEEKAVQATERSLKREHDLITRQAGGLAKSVGGASNFDVAGDLLDMFGGDDKGAKTMYEGRGAKRAFQMAGKPKAREERERKRLEMMEELGLYKAEKEGRVQVGGEATTAGAASFRPAASPAAVLDGAQTPPLARNPLGMALFEAASKAASGEGSDSETPKKITLKMKGPAKPEPDNKKSRGTKRAAPDTEPADTKPTKKARRGEYAGQAKKAPSVERVTKGQAAKKATSGETSKQATKTRRPNPTINKREQSSAAEFASIAQNLQRMSTALANALSEKNKTSAVEVPDDTITVANEPLQPIRARSSPVSNSGTYPGHDPKGGITRKRKRGGDLQEEVDAAAPKNKLRRIKLTVKPPVREQ